MPTPVDGASARDDVSEAYLEFPSRPDAMMASMLLGERIEPVLFDRIMKVITSDDFDSKALTLTRSTDYYLYVGNARTRQLGRMASQTQTRAAVPDDIVEGVAQSLADELDGAIAAYPRDEQTLRRQYHKSLKNMSLVQRNWVLPCRRALGRSFDLPRLLPAAQTLDARGAFALLRHPFAGPWCRDVVADSGCFVLARALLRGRLTAVRSFRYGLRCDALSLSLLVGLVDFLPLLETCFITLVGRRPSPTGVRCYKGRDGLDLEPLLGALAGLSRLAHLTLENFGFDIVRNTASGSVDEISSDLAVLEASLSLLSIHLKERGRTDIDQVEVARFTRSEGTNKFLRVQVQHMLAHCQ